MSKKMFLTKVVGVNPFLANCVAYYNVNANSNDSTINMHNGTDTSISYASAGIVNNCASFSGTSRIIIPQSTDFDFSDVTSDIPFTISFWLNPNTIKSKQWLFTKRNGSTAQYDIVLAGDGYIYCYLYTNTSNYIFARTDIPFTAGVGKYITISYSGNGLPSGIVFCIDGLTNSASATPIGTYTKMPITLLGQPVVIGAENFTGSFLLGFNGDLDEISIHKGVAYSQPMALDAYNKLLTGQSLI